ncbi:MAG: hypothetical protein EOO46_24630 [Flavobacterium sp.]|nr:MAG: hypothetical protein EOO46_24630 [Flavobacterium sp.]
MINVTFNNNAIPVPIKFQPVYKVIILLALLRYGTAKPHNATFLKLHLYMWALRDEKNLDILYKIKNKQRQNLTPWSFEVSMEKTVTLAVINQLCERSLKSGELQVSITTKGLELLQKIETMGLFADDLSKIKTIGNIPQSTILAANKNWEIF